MDLLGQDLDSLSVPGAEIQFSVEALVPVQNRCKVTLFLTSTLFAVSLYICLMLKQLAAVDSFCATLLFSCLLILMEHTGAF